MIIRIAIEIEPGVDMLKKYVVTFHLKITDFEPVIEKLKHAGAQIESIQKFIGTVIIDAPEKSILKIKEIPEVSGVTESVEMQVIQPIFTNP